MPWGSAVSLFTTCTACGARQPIDAGFLGEDGKRLAVLLGDMPPVLARAVIGYLGLFKPPKTELRPSTALKRAQELQALVAVGTVCKDERSGLRRPAAPEVWAAGIETMLLQRASLSLPLDGHNYLRAVVFGLADRADATAERQREAALRGGRRPPSSGVATADDPIADAKAWARQMVEYGRMTQADADAHVAKVQERSQ